MIALHFAVNGAAPKHHAASPTIAFDLAVTAGEPVEALVLRAEVRIEPQWREYDGRERTLLNDLFGTPDRWNVTLRTFTWADVPLVVTGFDERTNVPLNVACTYDFDQAATRYLNALEGGEIPLRFFFSGAVYGRGETGLSTQRVPWSSEAAYRMPVDVWREALRACYGDDALIRVSRNTLQALHRVRSLSGSKNWDDLFARLLSEMRT